MKTIKNFISKNKLDILFIICLLIFNIGIINKYIQNDTLFTIPTGNYILENGVNEVEPFTFHENLKFIKLRWAFDVVVATIYNIFNFQGIYIFTLIISMLISILLYNFLNKLNNNKIISFIIPLCIIAGSQKFLVCRAQIISYMLFVIEAFLLEKLIKTNEKKYIILTILTAILLANFHSSVWPVFFLPFLPIFAEKIIYKITYKKNWKILNKFTIENHNLKNLTITFFACLFAGLISPLGLTPYTYMFKVMSGITKKFIMELEPIQIIETFPLNIFVAILLLAFLLKKVKIKISDIFLILGFSIIAKLALRNVFIALFFISYPITRIINSIIIEYDKKQIIKKLEENIIINILIVLAILGITIYNYQYIKNQDYIVDYKYPVDVVKYMDENINKDTARILVEFDPSTYVEFSGYKICLDTRTEVYCKEFSNVTILEDWYNVYIEQTMSIMDFVEKYDITHLILYRDNILARDLIESKMLYYDSNFVLYEMKK